MQENEPVRIVVTLDGTAAMQMAEMLCNRHVRKVLGDPVTADRLIGWAIGQMAIRCLPADVYALTVPYGHDCGAAGVDELLPPGGVI